jgi:hypothetical protein
VLYKGEPGERILIVVEQLVSGLRTRDFFSN